MRDESSRLQRVLLGTSVALFAGLLGWILVSYALAPEEMAVVEIPASWEPPRSSPSPDWDDPETAAVGGGRGEPRRHFNRGTALLRQDRTEEAVAAFEQALALHPHYGEARYNLALALGRLGRVDAAIEAYRRVVEADRSAWSAKSHYNLALLLSGQDRLREARAALDAALRLRPDFVKARYNRALLLARMELTSEALDDYRKLLDLEPDHARARLKLGALLLREGDLEAAREHLERAVADEPGSERAHHKLGLCLMKLGENERAAAALGRAVEIDPEYVEAHYNRGLARQRTKDLAGAAQSFRRAVALRGDRADYRYRLGVALARSGDAEAAIEQYQEALLLRPGYFHALHALGLAHYRSGDYEPALQSFLEANSARPESYDAAYNLGLTLLKLGRPAEAEERFRQTLALEETTEARYNHGLALARQGRLRDAMASYRAALRIDPKHARSIERLAESHLELGAHEEALARLTMLQALQPDDPTAYNAGLRLYREDRLPLAVRFFSVAARGEASLRRKGLLMQGRALAKLGDTDAARETLAAALAEFPGDPAVERELSRVRERSAPTHPASAAP